MDSLDREIAEAFADQPQPQGPGRILIVGGAARRRKAIATRLTAAGHASTCVTRMDEALEAVNREHHDIVLLHPEPDGDGLELVRRLGEASPATRTILLSSAESFDQAVQALRCGVVDLVDAKASPAELTARIEQALKRSRTDSQREQRLAQLKLVCKKLVAARQEVSEHLDRLCQDLVAAYQDVDGQIGEVTMATEFKTLLKQELDVEDLLRTALEYLLSRTGPTNAAVFLPDGSDSFELGAYVNYDCPRETITVLLNHLSRAVCPQMGEEREIVSFDDAGAFAEWVGADAGFMAGCQVLAFSCRHDARCMAVMVLFRSKDEPFDEGLAATIDILRTIFAEQLASVIRIHHRAAPQWPKEPTVEDEYDTNDYDDFGFGGLTA